MDELLAPDPRLDALLAGIPCPRYVFTNGSGDHARRVLRRLGVERHFAAVFDIASTGFTPKPEPEAFSRMLGEIPLEPRRALYVDDLAANTAAAASLGMTTILLREGAEPPGGVSRAVGSLGELAAVLPVLLERGPAPAAGTPPP